MSDPDLEAPAPLTLDNDPDVLNEAQNRLRPQGFFHRKIKGRKSKSKERKEDEEDQSIPISSLFSVPEGADPESLDIVFDNVRKDAAPNETEDVYAWAVLYENQRGATILSTPYYSRFSLLPRIDPYPYSLPDSYAQPRKHQPNVTPEQFPLPDGQWQWVSKAWMVDMGSVGSVQHDGFEYNSSFRTQQWHAFMNSKHGALVRRRRWIRLMMRPGHPRSSQLSHQEGEESHLITQST